MDGSESKDDLDRCAIFDLLFRDDEPGDVDYLSKFLEIDRGRVRQLTHHCWFNKDADVVAISRKKGAWSQW